MAKKKIMSFTIEEEQCNRIREKAENLKCSKAELLRSMINVGLPVVVNMPAQVALQFDIQKTIENMNVENLEESKEKLSKQLIELQKLHIKEGEE